ncbi:formin-binding protein [Savitreella phatthalungensis]
MSTTCFANEFWGMQDDAGVTALITRMSDAKTVNEELRAYYKERASIEDEYARRLTKLSRQPLGTGELGFVHEAIETLKQETASMAQQHSQMATQLKVEVDDAHSMLADTIREKRKGQQAAIEKLWRLKTNQYNDVRRLKERYDGDCMKINGHLAQQNLLLGRELDKNNVKLDKVQQSVKVSQTDYRQAVQTYSETVAKWNKEWKQACDVFQDLEEERLTGFKSIMWTLSNVISAVCVTDDEACERIRQSLERVEVVAELDNFVAQRRTGNEIPDPPRFRAFGEDAEHDSTHDYTIANFIRQAGPQRSMTEDEARAKQSQTPSHQRSQSRADPFRTSPQQTVVNPYPTDGITQLCRSDSNGTYVSRTNSVAESAITTSSVYSSVPPSSNRHTPQASLELMSGRDGTASRGGLVRKKSFLTRDDGSSWFARPSSSQGKTAPAAASAPSSDALNGSHGVGAGASAGATAAPPLKAQKTGGSIFDALRPARSRSKSRSSAREPEQPSTTAPAATVTPADQSALRQSTSSHSIQTIKGENRLSRSAYDESDPIAAALERLKVSSRPSSNADPNSPKRTPAMDSRASPTREFVDGRGSPTRAGPSIDTLRALDASTRRGGSPERFSPQHQQQVGSNGYAPGDLRRSTTSASNSTASTMQRDGGRDSPEPRRGGAGYDRYAGSVVSDASRASHRSGGSYNGQALEPKPALQSPSQHPRTLSPTRDPHGYVDERRSRSHQSLSGYTQQHQHQQHYPGESPYETRARSRSQSRGSPERSVHDQRPGTNGSSYHDREAVGGGGGGGGVNGRVSPERVSQLQRQHTGGSGSSARGSSPGKTPDGRVIMTMARALYDYAAAAPEEVSFNADDLLAITDIRQDGWWIGEHTRGPQRSRRGLVPSNFFTRV